MSDEAEKNINIEQAADEEQELSQETAAEANVETDGDSGLTHEHVGHLLKVLGDDIINDMLESAGLTHEDVDAVYREALVEEWDRRAGIVKRIKRHKALRRFLFVAIFIGIILAAAAVNKIYNSVTINNNDPIQYAEHVDEISADEGYLHVNNVTVVVPTDGTEEYSISYAWSENDGKYPSVPHAITAIYSKKPEADTENAEGDAAEASEAADATEAAEEPAEPEKLYSISLYRNDTTPKKKVSKGKKVSNWFDDWKTSNEGPIIQTPLKSGNINGFYIFPQQPADGTASDYNDFSYYFAVKDDEGISVYVIEGVCIDPERDTEFRNIMDNCIHSISIK